MAHIEASDVKLVLIPESAERKVRTGKRRRREVTLLRYDVMLGDTRIGEVGRRMATFEQRTPGRVYVNNRWTSPRWFYEMPDLRYIRADYETRKQALENLIEEYNRDQDENNA